MGERKLWSRTFIVLMGVNFCSALSFYLTMVKITEFSMDTYGVAHSVAGLGISAYVISALFTRLVFGGRIDSWGVRRALAIGSAVNAAAMALYLMPMPFPALLAVRVAHGFGFAIMSGSAAAGAALVIPRHRYGEGIGYFSMMQALATGIGPFAAILVTNAFGGYSAMFGVATVFACLALASIALLKIPPSGTGAAPGASEHAATGPGAAEHAAAELEASEHVLAGPGAAGTAADAASSPDAPLPAAAAGDEPNDETPLTAAGAKKRNSLLQWSVVPLASVLLLCYFGYAGILSFITLYADELRLGDEVTLYFVVYAAVILISRPPVGRRVDRKGENSIIYWCFISLAVGLAVLGFTVNGAMLLASAALVGFGIGATQSIVQAIIARDTPPDELGRANSTFFMGMDLGSGVGPIVIGAAIPFIGYRGSYLALAVVAVIAGVVYHAVHGRRKRREGTLAVQ